MTLGVLIVDDHKTVRDGIRSLLTGRADCFVCGEAADGVQAVEIARDLRPDVILMDLLMPRMDGAEATRIIRRELPDSRIILVSQNDPALLSRRAAEIGACGYVSKSDLARDLMPAIFSARNGQDGNASAEAASRITPGVSKPKSRFAATAGEVNTSSQLPNAHVHDREQVHETHEQELFRLAQTAAHIGTWEWDAADGTSNLSAELYRIFGTDPSDAHHVDTWASNLHPQDREKVFQLMREGYDAGEMEFEYRYRHPELGVRWLYCKGRRVRNEPRMFGVVLDVTERKDMEESVRRNEQRLRAIIETTPECVKLIGADGTVLHMNAVGLAMVGAESPSQVVGRSAYNLVAPEDRDRFRAFNETICRGEKASLEYDIVGLRGTRRHMETHSAPLLQSEGSFVHLGVTRDITERTQAASTNALLAAIVDSSDDAIVSKNLDGFITSWNKGAERIFGYSAREAIGQHITFIIPRDRLSEEDEILRRLRRGERLDHFETVRRRKDGTLLEVSATISPLRTPDGMIIGASKVARDITERKRAEKALRESEERFRVVTEASPVMVWMSGPDKLCYYFNKRWLEFVGRTLEQECGNGWAENVHPDDFERCLQIYLTNFDARRPFQMEYRLRHHTGEYRWILDHGVPRFAPDGAFEGYMGGCLDIHDQKCTTEALRQSEERFRALSETLESEVLARTRELEQRNAEILKQSEQLRELSWQLLRTQDEERRHIARELHDSAGQILAVLSMSLTHLMESAKQKAPDLAQGVEQADRLLQQLSGEIRTTSYLLHPPLLDEVGLEGALSWYIDGLRKRSDLQIDLSVSEDFGRLPRDMELVVFRMVQECLTNIHRHSGSQMAWIQVGHEPDKLVVEVRDQGKGIPADKLAEIQSKGSGVGIRGMRERLRQFHGEMTVESSGAGTTVRAVIPVPSEAPAVPEVPGAAALRSIIPQSPVSTAPPRSASTDAA